jgi:hypothetical protein
MSNRKNPILDPNQTIIIDPFFLFRCQPTKTREILSPSTPDEVDDFMRSLTLGWSEHVEHHGPVTPASAKWVVKDALSRRPGCPGAFQPLAALACLLEKAQTHVIGKKKVARERKR